MSPTILHQLTDRLGQSPIFLRRFPETKSEAFPNIAESIAADVSKRTGLQLLIDREFLAAFDDTIAAFCESKLHLPARSIDRHLYNVRIIGERKTAKNAHAFESVEWYLAIFGLTIDSDPTKITLAFRAMARSNSAARRLFDEIHGGLPRTEFEILAIRKFVLGSLDSVRECRKSNRKPYKPSGKVPKATEKQHSFASTIKAIKAQKDLPKNHPALKDGVKTALNRFATGSNSRTEAISDRVKDRIEFTFEALIFVEKESLDIPLTSIRRVLEAYIMRPILNISPDRLEALRLRFVEGPNDYLKMVREPVRMALICDAKDPQSAFPDPKEVSMAYSYLNLDVRSRQIYTISELEGAAQAIKSGQLDPHSGDYRSPYIQDETYEYWQKTPTLALKVSVRAIKNANSRIKVL